MSKKQTQEAVEEFVGWMTNYERPQAQELVGIVSHMLASLPGGDEFEEIGYEPFPFMGWHEFSLIEKVFAAVESSEDVEYAFELMFRQDLEDEEDGY